MITKLLQFRTKIESMASLDSIGPGRNLFKMPVLVGAAQREIVMRIFHSIMGLAAIAAATPASAALLYANDFDGSEVLGTGISLSAIDPTSLVQAATVGPWNAAGWAGNHYVNNTGGNPASITQLTFTGLDSHTSVNLGGIIGFLDSWDGNNSPNGFDPDNLEFYIDNVLVAVLTSNGGNLGAGQFFDGATVIANNQQVDNNFFFSDTLIDLGSANFATFAHSGSSLVLGIRASGGGWQGGNDESWGWDAINITYNAGAVPEPAAWALMLAGFGLTGAAMRRRAKVRVSYA